MNDQRGSKEVGVCGQRNPSSKPGTPGAAAVPPAPFDLLEAYAFMLWMWAAYPHELVEYATEYHAEKQATIPNLWLGAMNVQDLIEELKKMSPLQPVRVFVRNEGCEDCGNRDAEGELLDVSFQGNHIRLEANNG